MKKTILVVEDDLTLQRALSDKLTKEGFLISGAKNGQEGLDMAKAGHPDLILLDIVMPVMDGMTMLGELRKDDWGKGAEVIILTNLFDQKKVADAIALGSFDYLVKTDWSMADVVRIIKGKLDIK
jgi:DNA-binding response OmpR family regulator